MVYYGFIEFNVFLGSIKCLKQMDIPLKLIFKQSTVLLTLWLCSCAITPVEPWQKGNLAKPEMTFEGDTLDKNFTEHTYFSKEGAFGGSGVGGGGCGCN